MADIELVIKIPENVYKNIQSLDWKNIGRWSSEELKAIHNGTQLPKGHGKLIDARAFSGEMFCEADLTDAHTCYDSIQRLLEKEPTVIEADGGVE